MTQEKSRLLQDFLDVISKVTMIDYWMCFETCEDMESTILVTGESIKSFQSEVAAVSCISSTSEN